ncbi:MAG: glycine cleavage system aminomethyltransferase GcvT [Actinobacteria bacterium]|nr:glycine cleavage system aminomethyltransferase GcvT [Actinomycetota bacterium]
MSSQAPATPLRRTSLYEAHVAAGAKIVPFAGWEMPVQYADGIKVEHLTVRSDAGLFDVSHMGEIETAGPQAVAYLQRLFTNDVTKMPVGGAQYALICREDGGVIDDLFTYRLAENRFLTVTNASNHATDFAWFAENAGGFDVDVIDRANEYAMLALQGPAARDVLSRVIDGAEPVRMKICETRIAGASALVAGTGYTGEDGVEMMLAPGDAAAVWNALLAEGAVPAGLGARDTLRLEVCFPLYGNELSLDRNPLEAGLGWAVALDTGFIGAEALIATNESGPAQRLVPFVFTGPGIPRQGNAVFVNDAEIGVVTSGTMAPSLDVGAGMAYVNSEFAEPGTAIEVDVRGKPRAAEIRAKPLYKRPA